MRDQLSIFSRRRPSNKSHREEAILAKDLVRQALREAEKNGRNECARADLQRILDLAGEWKGNRAEAKAVFACSSQEHLARVRSAASVWRRLNCSSIVASI